MLTVYLQAQHDCLRQKGSFRRHIAVSETALDNLRKVFWWSQLHFAVAPSSWLLAFQAK